MEIIFKGKIPSERVWFGTCHFCGTKAKAKEGELTITSDQREGDFGQAKCPVCNRIIYFYRKDSHADRG